MASESVEAPRQLSLEEELTMLLTGADKPRAEPVPGIRRAGRIPADPSRAGRTGRAGASRRDVAAHLAAQVDAKG